MKHFGDITKLTGYTLPIVDVITGGSPCQDLSVAGKPNSGAGRASRTKRRKIMDKVRFGVIGLGNMGSGHVNNLFAGKIPGALAKKASV